MVSISNYQTGVDPRSGSGSNRLRMNGSSAVSPDALQRVLAAYSLDDAQCAPLGHGLINLTMLVTAPDGRRFVLQRVNPLFPAEVNLDIDVVTRRLAEAGLITPRLVSAVDDRLWLELDDGVWRLLTFIDGDVYDRVQNAAQAGAAGALLARFHRTLDGLQHRFANPRLGVHDTSRHLARLRSALSDHRTHPRYRDVQPLAQQILELAGRLDRIRPVPDRIVHGDPKINNMLFDRATGTGRALVDLDTVGMMPLPLELGDAFRSWCNPAGEDGCSGEFSVELFGAGLEGYVSVAAGWLTPDELAEVVPSTWTIVVELAARFCADALYENYFGWDPGRFSSRSEHNQVRAAGQLGLAKSLEAVRPELERIADRLLSGI